MAPAPRSVALRCAPGGPASRSGCREPPVAAKRAPGRGVGTEKAGAGPRYLLGTYGQGATWTTQRHLGGAESTNAEGRLVAVPRSGQQHVLRRGAVPIDDQVASGEVTADEGVVPKAGAELVAAAGVEGTADFRGALPHERREVADIPSWGFALWDGADDWVRVEFGVGAGTGAVVKAAWGCTCR